MAHFKIFLDGTLEYPTLYATVVGPMKVSWFGGTNGRPFWNPLVDPSPFICVTDGR